MSSQPGAAVDLRSDTFTAPDTGMRRAMAEADVGDDVWGEDPTVHRLEAETASRLGKEAGLFVPSGTMGNLVSIAAQVRPGDEVIADSEAHVVIYEVAGTAVVAGVQLRLIDCADAVPTPEQVTAAVREPNIHHPASRVLALENTHNRRGGRALEPERISAAAAAAHRAGLRVHCDGARLFNAAVALGCEPAELVRDCDTVSVCLSKGLGAPVGSVIAADVETIGEARRWRKRLGGGMRQAGVLAAAGLYAFEHNLGRLADDHARAARLADALDGVAKVEVVRVPNPTNIVLLRTPKPAAAVIDAARAEGVLVSGMGPHLVRCMTHLDVDDAGIDRAIAGLHRALAA